MNATGKLEDFSRLLTALYGGLLAEPPWEDFLRSLANWLGGTYATLILTAPGTSKPGTIVTPGADPQTAEDYAESFFTSDPFKGLPEGRVTSFTEFLQGDTRGSAFWRDFLEAAGGDQILGVDLHFDSGFEARLRVTRDASRADFGSAEKDALQSVVPHLRDALRLFERLQAWGTEHGVYRGMVEQMGVAAIILDHEGKVMRTNAVAERLLAEKDGVERAGERLRLASIVEHRGLEKLLRSLKADTDPASLPAHRFRIERPSGRRDLGAVAKPVTAPAFMRSGAGAALALFVSDPGQDARPDPEAIRDLFQLTRMEAMLAAALAGGASLVDAADKLGIAHNTARSHLRSIFAKTGARRQSQLVHLLHAGMPELGGPSI
ncbi:helix-turn-helix transcriptional regulator [Sphingomonas cavernae]|uniref:Helix-turn-helix transcriptional regulator n=1 Tax=Sphingomonas cavernae TaxID=2320861 RepID=A0A418WPF8_9SPHN|nr:helix-turn-helix transcriptional regulator [Sphingomonas cavernae]RJF93138.1 helix-turn-helix transcriptional regulator [Sphingomonas cavernae]